MSKSKDKEKQKKPEISKTCSVVLDGGGVRLPVGEFTLRKVEPGPTLADFADEAFKSARNSLNKLMVPLYRLIVIDGPKEEAYGLGRWVKLTDGEKENAAVEKGRKKAPIHKRGMAT